MEQGNSRFTGPRGSPNAPAWGRRALLFTILFVFVLTLFPFQFLPRETAYRRTHSIPLWLSTGLPAPHDFLENIVFFLPLGFSLACWWEKRRWWRLLFLAWMAGAALSLLVEYLQVFLPSRGPQWSDVAANSLGAALGFLMFECAGLAILRFALRLEERIERFFTPPRIASAFGAYLALVLVCSAILQRSTNLAHWSRGDSLIIGNDATKRHPWHGRILRVEITDKAISPGHLPREGSAQERDRRRSATSSSPFLLDMSAGANDGLRVLHADVPGKNLVRDLQQTNRFTLRVVCVPNNTAGRSIGTLVSLARGPRFADFVLEEYGGRWIAEIRSRLAGKAPRWTLGFSGVPIAGKPKEVTVSFNGSELSAFVDGKEAGQSLSLNPGTSLVRYLKGMHMYNAYGYGILYDALALVPLGSLLALAARKTAWAKVHRWLAPALLLPPLLLEVVLASVSHRPFDLRSVVLGECLIGGAFLLLNSDRWDFRRRTMSP